MKDAACLVTPTKFDHFSVVMILSKVMLVFVFLLSLYVIFERRWMLIALCGSTCCTVKEGPL